MDGFSATMGTFGAKMGRMGSSMGDMGSRIGSMANDLTASLEGLGGRISSAVEAQLAQHTDGLGDRITTAVEAQIAQHKEMNPNPVIFMKSTSSLNDKDAIREAAKRMKEAAKLEKEAAKAAKEAAKRERHEAHAKASLAKKLERKTAKIIHKMEEHADRADGDPARLSYLQQQAAELAASLGNLTTRLSQRQGSMPDDLSATAPPPPPPVVANAESTLRVDAIYFAASMGHMTMLEGLLSAFADQQHPVPTDALEFLDGDMTPLLAATALGHADCARLLLDHGANPAAVDSHGNSALHLACMQGGMAATALFLRHPVRQVSPYWRNEHGHTALEVARSLQSVVPLETWKNIAQCMEVLEMRCKVFEGWIYATGPEKGAALQPKYALVMRTGSPLRLEMHLFNILHGLRVPVPTAIFEFAVHETVTVGHLTPLSIQIGGSVFAAFNEASLDAWQLFLTKQTVVAAQDPSLRQGIMASLPDRQPVLPSQTAPRMMMQPPPPNAPQPAPRVIHAPPLPPPLPHVGKKGDVMPRVVKQASAPPMTREPFPPAMPLPPPPSTKAKDLSAISAYVDTPLPPSAASAPALDNDAAPVEIYTREECIVCLDRPKQVVCVPCGHVAACVVCAEHIQQTTRKCPICRTDVRELIKLFLA
ncbi:Aste57867_17936 [Aphanomyces stellatus]|uniref:Aste57867_17936 protein n=1 Tax=Aphanomyces stellatus TaxID=120398 RepID=A0A485LCF4_9STRA|nr:hypothetical protein As57867_017874 [Aphanomyces stellatus]VFT94677.1 Aste57867_17936 [Aphanomyces stellatus]